MRRALCLAALGTAVLLQTLTAGHTGASVETRPLRVAMAGKYMPLHQVESGQATGFEADLARALARAMGRQVRFLDREQMKAGALAAVASDAADIALNAVTPTPERASKVDFTRPIAMLEYRVASGTGDPETAFAAACARSIAVSDGPAASAVREAKLPQKIVVVKTTQAGIGLLRKREVDCVVGEEIDLFLALEGAVFAVLDEAVGQSPISMAVPKGQGSAYNQVLDTIEDQIKDLRRRWQIRVPLPGLEYPRIAVAPRGPSAKPAARYVVVKSTEGMAAARENSPVLATFEIGTILDAPKLPAKADRWLEARYAGRQIWINADDVASLAGPFFSLNFSAPKADPNQPCVDTPCGCIVYQPDPENTVALTPSGSRLLTGDFAGQVIRNAAVDARRRLANIAVEAVLNDSVLNEVLEKRYWYEKNKVECVQKCESEITEGDGCCECGEEKFIGLDEAVAAARGFAEAFFDDDPDIEVRRRAKINLCAVLDSHSDLIAVEGADNQDVMSELCGVRRK